MRQFVLLAHDIPLDGDFSLEDLPGTGGRVDVLCRCLTAALLLSHDIRTDVRVRIVVQDAVTITLSGRELRRLNPDERSTAARLREALRSRDRAVGHRSVEISPGVQVSNTGLAVALEAADEEGTVLQLDPTGRPIISTAPPEDPVFLLSDHRPFSVEDQAAIDAVAPATRSLGPRPLHADHAIAIAHNWLDTDGYARYEPRG